ncbi:glutathione S-transferase [Mycena polygramma]|nr:glutathione S-transferase [Mycena polygramma]
MTLKLYGAAHTTSTRRVGTVLYAAKVPFDLIEVDIKTKEHKTPTYREKQPFGLIPYIDDGGFILYETRAICRYIAAKYPSCGLIPTDSKEHAIFEQAASVEVTLFDPSASVIGRLGLTPDQAVIDREIAAIDRVLEAYDVILARQEFIAGDVCTLADLFHLPYAPLLATAGSDVMIRKPNVARWYNALITMPCWLAFENGVKSTHRYDSL